MATYEVDKKMTDKDIMLLLDDALCQEEYPEPENIDLIDLKEYDRQTRQVFLWVSSLFTNEEWKYLEKHFQNTLSKRTHVAICRSDPYFGYDYNGELLEDTD